MVGAEWAVAASRSTVGRGDEPRRRRRPASTVDGHIILCRTPPAEFRQKCLYRGTEMTLSVGTASLGT
jgi:hypothetical protein